MFKEWQKARFKIKEEFEKEFGKDWVKEINWGWSYKMNYLFWTEVTIEEVDNQTIFFKELDDTWNYSTDMIVAINSFPREVEEEKKIEIKTNDWQTIEITKEKAIELWFNIKE